MHCLSDNHRTFPQNNPCHATRIQLSISNIYIFFTVLSVTNSLTYEHSLAWLWWPVRPNANHLKHRFSLCPVLRNRVEPACPSTKISLSSWLCCSTSVIWHKHLALCELVLNQFYFLRSGFSLRFRKTGVDMYLFGPWLSDSLLGCIRLVCFSHFLYLILLNVDIFMPSNGCACSTSNWFLVSRTHAHVWQCCWSHFELRPFVNIISVCSYRFHDTCGLLWSPNSIRVKWLEVHFLVQSRKRWRTEYCCDRILSNWSIPVSWLLKRLWYCSTLLFDPVFSTKSMLYSRPQIQSADIDSCNICVLLLYSGPIIQWKWEF